MLSLGARLARQHGASRLARRLSSRAGPNDAALARAPAVLREYLGWPVEEERPEFMRRHGGEDGVMEEETASKAVFKAFESEGMEKVLGIGPEVLEELRLIDPYRPESDPFFVFEKRHALEKVKSWDGITKGGDIFIPGLPKFDIMQAYATLMLDDARANGWEWPFWLVSVGELHAPGHFPAIRLERTRHQLECGYPPTLIRILTAGPQNPARQHLINHHAWWNNDENANALDELKRMAIWYDHGSSRWASDWPEGGEKLKPPTLLRRLREAEARRSLGPDIHFAHLDCIADPPAEGKLALRVLRRSHHIAHVAAHLSNCARSYIGRVKSGRYVLVGAFAGEKPKALAGYAAGGGGWDHRPVFFGNKNVDSGTGALFDAFLPALESWTPPAPPPKYEGGDDWDEHEEYEDEWY